MTTIHTLLLYTNICLHFRITECSVEAIFKDDNHAPIPSCTYTLKDDNHAPMSLFGTVLHKIIH